MKRQSYTFYLLLLITTLACKSIKEINDKPTAIYKYESTQEVLVPTIDTIVISGTLAYVDRSKLAIIIAGSGPTDRNCNSQLGLTTDAFKMLATELSAAGISSYRYDKRGIGMSTKVSQKSMTLYDRVVDIKALVDHFSADFDKIVLVGHSEGVIVGMMAAAEHHKVDAFVGIAGPSTSMKDVILEQMAKYPKAIPMLEKHFSELENDLPYSEVNPMFLSFFNEELRPFMKSAIEIDPTINITKLYKPTLIVGGRCDVQVATYHAEALHAACPNSSLLLVDSMGHVLKQLKDDCSNQADAYSDASLPLNDGFVHGLIGFLRLP